MEQLPIEFNRIQAQQSYTDLNQLNSIRKLGRDDQSEALRKVSQQFESMFVSLMLKSMRAANDVFAKDNPLNSFEMNFHRDMYDQQLSLSLSQNNRIGLADALYRQMEQSYSGNKINKEKNISDDIISKGINVNRNMDNTRRVHNNPYYKNSDSILKNTHDNKILDYINSPEDFVRIMKPFSETVAKTLGLNPKVLIAQAALETGWGEFVTRDSQGRSSLNLFNIKADKRWEGNSVKVPTIEYRNGVAQREMASFRRYDSIIESFKDYQRFLQQPRYQSALSVAGNSDKYLNELQKAGYATDPDYAKKISRIIKGL